MLVEGKGGMPRRHHTGGGQVTVTVGALAFLVRDVVVSAWTGAEALRTARHTVIIALAVLHVCIHICLYMYTYIHTWAVQNALPYYLIFKKVSLFSVHVRGISHEDKSPMAVPYLPKACMMSQGRMPVHTCTRPIGAQLSNGGLRRCWIHVHSYLSTFRGAISLPITHLPCASARARVDVTV